MEWPPRDVVDVSLSLRSSARLIFDASSLKSKIAGAAIAAPLCILANSLHTVTLMAPILAFSASLMWFLTGFIAGSVKTFPKFQTLSWRSRLSWRYVVYG